MSPRAAPLPISETLSGPKYSGKMVTMSIRTASRLDGFGRVEQPGRRVDDQTAAGHVDLGHDRAHERDQRVGGRVRGPPARPPVPAVAQDVRLLAAGTH